MDKDWQEENGALFGEFKFRDFQHAFEFMKHVAAAAEGQNHHPRWHNEWNIVKIWLTTHDAENTVTEKDRMLAKTVSDIYQAVKDDSSVPQVSFDEIKLYADGGSRGNPGPSASGYVLLDSQDNIIEKSGVYLGITTNNQAEYHALKVGLEQAQKLGVRTVHVFMDSLLVVNQMKGVFKVRNRDLWPVHQSIKDMLGNFEKVIFTHVPRELNKLADAEVNETLDAVKDGQE